MSTASTSAQSFELTTAERLFAELETILAQELAAIAALRIDEVTALAEQKRDLTERLRALSVSEISAEQKRGDEGQRRRNSVREASTRLMAQAEANVALLSDAIAAISASLGRAEDAGTYDARARVKQEVRPFAGQRA